MGKDKFSRKGTVALRTLKRPTVQDLTYVHLQKASGTVDKDKLELVKESGLDGLANLLNYDHARVQVLVPSIINSLVRTDDGEATLVADQPWANMLELCTLKENDIRTDAIWTVAILAANPESHEQIIGTFGWKTLLSFVRAENADIQIAANVLIGNLSIKEENQEQMIESGGLKVMLEQAKTTTNPQIKHSAAIALSNAVMESDNAREFVKLGGVELLSQFLDSDDADLVRISISAITNLVSSDEPDIKTKVISDIGLKKLVELLSNSDSQVHKSAAIAIGHYASQEEHQQALVDLGAINVLVSLLTSADSATSSAAAVTISNLSQDSKISKVMYDSGVGEKLKPLLSAEDSEIKAEATTALANINLHAPVPEPEPEVVEPAKEPEAPVPVEKALEAVSIQEVTVAAPEPTTVVEEAAPAAAPMPDEPVAAPAPASKKEESVDLSQVQGLLDKIAAKDAAQQKEGANGLSALLTNVSGRESVVGAIGPKGLNVLHTAFAEAKDQALMVDLAKIFVAVAATPIREKIRFAEIAQQLFNMLSLTPEAQNESLTLLTPITFKNPNNQAIVMKYAFIDSFINLLRPTSSEEIRGKAAKAVHAVTFQNRQAQQLFNKRKVFPLLVALLETNNLQVQKSACGAVYAVAEGNFANQTEFRKVNVLTPLTKLLASPEESVRQGAAGTFYSLLRDNKKVQELSLNAIPNIIGLLGSKSVPVLSNATAAITELIRGSDKNQDAFCTPDAAKALVTLLASKDFWVVFNTLTIISALIKKKVPVKRREIFHHVGLEQSISPLLTTEHQSIKKEATKLLGYVKDYK